MGTGAGLAEADEEETGERAGGGGGGGRPGGRAGEQKEGPPGEEREGRGVVPARAGEKAAEGRGGEGTNGGGASVGDLARDVVTVQKCKWMGRGKNEIL